MAGGRGAGAGSPVRPRGVVPVRVGHRPRPEGAEAAFDFLEPEVWSRSSASAGGSASPVSGSMTGSGAGRRDRRGGRGSRRGCAGASLPVRWRGAARRRAAAAARSRSGAAGSCRRRRRLLGRVRLGIGGAFLGVVAGEDGAEEQGHDQDAEQDDGGLGGHVRRAGRPRAGWRWTSSQASGQPLACGACGGAVRRARRRCAGRDGRASGARRAVDVEGREANAGGRRPVRTRGRGRATRGGVTAAGPGA